MITVELTNEVQTGAIIEVVVYHCGRFIDSFRTCPACEHPHDLSSFVTQALEEFYLKLHGRHFSLGLCKYLEPHIQVMHFDGTFLHIDLTIENLVPT